MNTKIMARQLLILTLALLLIAPTVFATEKKMEEAKPDSAAAAPKISESMVIDWPKEDQWTPDYLYTGKTSRIQLYFPKGQSSSGWNEMFSVETDYGKNGYVVGFAREVYLGTVKGSSNATWNIIEKGNSKHGYPYCLFEVDCPDFLSGEKPQVQLWKMTLGKTGLLTVQYSYRGKEMPEKRKTQILDVLKNAYLQENKE